MKNHLLGKRGAALLQDPLLNKGTGFSAAERDALGLRGLLPPRVSTQLDQQRRVLDSVRHEPTDLGKYLDLLSVLDRNEALYYRVIIDNLVEMMPIIYTPTVGLACQRWGEIFRRSRGMYLTTEDRGHIVDVMRNWPYTDVRMIVVTDGERVLGLGDLGANGMGIPVGKLSLYTACAGLHPAQCMPVTLDVGTDNDSLLDNPNYIGRAVPRLRGPAYAELVDEFIAAVQQLYPHACVQFEDFGNSNAFRLLNKYRDRICTFNDDIQGTAGVALAGLYSASHMTGVKLTDMRFLFLGAGEAGIGIGDLIVEALKAEGVSNAAAHRQCWFMDSKGLVVQDRGDLVDHKVRFAHEHLPVADLLTAVEILKPHAIIGVSGKPSAFTQEVVQAMARHNERPIILALSNPTSKSECTAEEAYAWSNGRAIFASGSPFAPVTHAGRIHVPGQGNNAYIFPGVGLGVVATEATRVTDEMFFVAAKTLAGCVTEEDMALGRIYPDLNRIREVSRTIALAVADVAFSRGLTAMERPADLAAYIESQMYEPEYVDYL
jgi:malate dehydrogenase (oxaloacetate-decarboxylating)(NADP+)